MDGAVANDPLQASFVDAMVVPQLAMLCSEYVSQTPHGLTGLKVLRLVSKQLSVGMLSHVESYNLQLTAALQPLSAGAVALLRQTRLSRLCVTFTTVEGVERDFAAENLQHLQEYMADFIITLGASLRTVTALEFEIHSLPTDHLGHNEPNSSAFTAQLGQLAQACLDSTSLKLSGYYSEGLLEEFGIACRGLIKLELEAVSLREGTIQHLQQLLPHVCNVAYHNPLWHIVQAGDHGYLKVALAALENSTSITSVTIRSDHMDSDMWSHLPAGLVTLELDQDELSSIGPAPGGVPLLHLKSVAWESDIEGASNLISVAPQLESMEGVILVGCDVRMLPLWTGFCAMIVAGFMARVKIYLTDDGNGQFSGFLSQAQPMPSISTVEMHNMSAGVDPNPLAQLSRVFTNLIKLDLYNLAINDDMLQSLWVCNSLCDVNVVCCDNVSGAGFAVLSLRLPSLRGLNLYDCERFGDAEIADLISLLITIGALVAVTQIPPDIN